MARPIEQRRVIPRAPRQPRQDAAKSLRAEPARIGVRWIGNDVAKPVPRFIRGARVGKLAEVPRRVRSEREQSLDKASAAAMCERPFGPDAPRSRSPVDRDHEHPPAGLRREPPRISKHDIDVVPEPIEHPDEPRGAVDHRRPEHPEHILEEKRTRCAAGLVQFADDPDELPH